MDNVCGSEARILDEKLGDANNGVKLNNITRAYFSKEELTSYCKDFTEFIEHYLHTNTSDDIFRARICGFFIDCNEYGGKPAAYYIKLASNFIEHSPVLLSDHYKRLFLDEVIFRIVAIWKAKKSQTIKGAFAKFKVKAASTGEQALPDLPWPTVFEHPHVREAFTLCTSALTDAEICQMLTDSWDIYFPLMVCNYEAASQIRSWPIIDPSDVSRIFDMHNLRIDEFGNLPIKLENHKFRREGTLAKYYQHYRSFGLPAFRLPLFLASTPIKTLKVLLDITDYDLFPIEADALMQARGGPGVLFDELRDEPRAWCLLRMQLLRTDNLVTANVFNATQTSASTSKQISRRNDYSKKNSKSKPRKKVLLPPPSAEQSMEFGYDSGPFVDLIKHEANVNQRIRDIIVPCVQYLIISDVLVKFFVMCLTKLESSPTSHHVHSWRDSLESHLQRVLAHRSVFIASAQNISPLAKQLPIFPLSATVRLALFQALGIHDGYNANNDMISAIGRFINRIPDAAESRKLALTEYMSPTVATASNTMTAGLTVWIDCFKRFDLTYRPLSLMALTLLFDVPLHFQDEAHDDAVEMLGGQIPPMPVLIISRSFRETITLPWEPATFQPSSSFTGHFDSLATLISLHFEAMCLIGLLEFSQTNGWFPAIDASIGRGRFDELGLESIQFDGSETRLTYSFYNIGYQLAIFGRQHGRLYKLIGPILNRRQMQPLIGFDLWADEDEENLGARLLNESMKSFDGLNVKNANIRYDRLLYAMHTIPDQIMLDYLNQSEWIVNFPDRLISSCHRDLWIDAEFLDRVWEVPAAVLLALIKREHGTINLAQILIADPLISRTMRFINTALQVRQCLWCLTKYLVMRDYEFKIALLMVESQRNINSTIASGGLNWNGKDSLQAAESFWINYLDLFVTEVDAKINLWQALQDFSIELALQNADDHDDVQRLQSDFDWLITEGRFLQLISAERMHFLVNILGKFPGRMSQNPKRRLWMQKVFQLENVDDSFCGTGLSDAMSSWYDGHARLLEMMERLAPSPSVAHVWMTRSKICELGSIIVRDLGPDAKVTDFNLTPEWLTEALDSGTIPLFDAIIAKESSEHLKLELIKLIVKRCTAVGK